MRLSALAESEEAAEEKASDAARNQLKAAAHWSRSLAPNMQGQYTPLAIIDLKGEGVARGVFLLGGHVRLGCEVLLLLGCEAAPV